MERLNTVSDLVEIAGKQRRSNVIIAGGDRVEDLLLVEAARDHGIIERIVLVGNRERIEKSLGEVRIDIDSQDIIHAESDEKIGKATVDFVNSGGIDIVLKGNISTPIINRHMLTLAQGGTVSLSSIFDSDSICRGKPIILTDPGVTTVCSIGRLIDMINNSVDVARTVMGIERPKVAFLSANEKQIPSLRSTWVGLQLAKRKWASAIVSGPLSFDLATDSESVTIKGLPDCPNAELVAGDADILVCPGIDSANILYKSISAMAKAGRASIAGVTVGFKIPYIILSRSDTLSTRLESIALSSIYMQRKIQMQKDKAPEEDSITINSGSKRILVINPGSTSLKLAVFEDNNCVHKSETEFDSRATVDKDQLEEMSDMLAETILGEIDNNALGTFHAIAARGGFLAREENKLSGGTYLIAARTDEGVSVHQPIVKGILEHCQQGHASNLAIPTAAKLAVKLGIPAYMTDPVVADEFEAVAEISGYAPIKRKSTAHFLSIKAAAKKAATACGRPLEDCNFVVAHLGGGVTVAAVKSGKVTDNSIALSGEGPFTPQRSGGLPTGDMIDLCYSGSFTANELKEELSKRAGLVSYLGEHRMEQIEKRIEDGDDKAKLIVDAMIYQMGKEIGAMFSACECNVEAIVLTGGLVSSNYIRKSLARRIAPMAPVITYPGSLEMEALALGAYEVLTGKCQAIIY